MTKRSIENDLSNVSEHILGDLEPENRLRLTLEAWAAGDETRNERLMETVPRYKGSFPDPRFTERHHQVVTLSLDATRTLETGVWMFHWARAEGRYKDAMWQAWGSEKGGEEGWEFLEEPTPENDFHEGMAMEMAARFLKSYLLYTRFAEEQLDVSLEEFLSLSSIPGGNATFDLIENAAKMVDGRMHEEFHDSDENGPEPHPDFEPGWGKGVTFEFNGERRTAEEAAEIEYEALADAWDGTNRPSDSAPHRSTLVVLDLILDADRAGSGCANRLGFGVDLRTVSAPIGTGGEGIDRSVVGNTLTMTAPFDGRAVVVGQRL